MLLNQSFFMKFKLRNHTESDMPFLKEMLFEAAYWRPDMERPSIEEGLSLPELKKILSGWGRKGDTAVIAETSDRLKTGAAWYRFWTEGNHSYGFVKSQIPEIGMAVVREYRGQGIGNALLRELIRIADENKIYELSLSVESDNPARYLYLKHRFIKVNTVANSWTMVRKSNP
jgi:ribosomal protein S18 acetylase RimI-like enzyme